MFAEFVLFLFSFNYFHLYEIPSNNIVVNQLLPQNDTCYFCTMRRNMQMKNLKDIRYLYGGKFNLTEVYQFPREIRGVNTLTKLGEILFE